MKLSLFWKLMLSFALVVAIGLGAVVVLANQVTTRELHQLMMGNNGPGMMGPGGGMGQGGPPATAGTGLGQEVVIERVNRAVIVGGLVALIAALLIGFLVFRGITRPVEQLTHAAQSLAKGNLSARVTVGDQLTRLGSDELSELGTAFNSMAEHLQQSERLRRDMTADLAHELRTPLAVMRGNLEAMIDHVYAMDAEHLTPVLDQVNLLSRLIEDLRTLALAEAGQLQLVKRPTDLNALIASTLTSFEAPAAAQHITLRSGVASNLPSIPIDPDRIQQTIAILISNALHHTPANGLITISTQRDSGGLLLKVIDTGSGIPPEDLPHVFERFYRADKSRSRESGGSGLGLAIARGIVEAHGGSIAVTSSMGKGTTMTIALPINDKTTKVTR
jgi:signal transduction histidine kinase